jgi:hypothetical protein
VFVPPSILVDAMGYRVLCRALPAMVSRRFPDIYLSEYGVVGKTEHDFVRANVMLQRIGLLQHIIKGWDTAVYAHSMQMFSMEDRDFTTALFCDDVGSLFCIPLRPEPSPLRPEPPEGSDSLPPPPVDPALFELEEWQWRPELFNYYGDILGSTSADEKLRLLTVCGFVTKVVVPDALSALVHEHGSTFTIMASSSHDVLEKRRLLSTELQRYGVNCRLLGIALVYVASTGVGASFKNIILHEMVARTMRTHWRQYLATDAKQGGRSGGLDIQLSIFLQRIFRNHGNYVSKFLIPSVFERYAKPAIQWVDIANACNFNRMGVDDYWCTLIHDHKITVIFMQAGISPTVHIDQPNVTLQDLFAVEDVILRFLNLIGASQQNVDALDVFLKLGKFNSSTPTHVPVNISEMRYKSLAVEIQARIEVDRLTANSIAIYGARHRLNDVLRQLELYSCLIPYPWFGKTLLARTHIEIGQSTGGELKRASIDTAATNLSQALACNPYQSFLLLALSNLVVKGALDASNHASKARPKTQEAKVRLGTSHSCVPKIKVSTPSRKNNWEWRYATGDDIQGWKLDNLFVLAHVIKDAKGLEQPNAWLTHMVGLAVDIVSQACKEVISPFCQRGAFEVAGQIFRRVHATLIKWNESTGVYPIIERLKTLIEVAQSVTPQILGDPQPLSIPKMFEDDRQLGIFIGYCLINDCDEYAKFMVSSRAELIITGAVGRCASAPCLETILKLRETSNPDSSLGLDTVSIAFAENADDRLLKMLRKRMKLSRNLLIGNLPRVTNQGISGLLIRSHNLKSITFQKCKVANDSLLFKITPLLTALSSLSITSNDMITDAGVRCIQQITSLTNLDLHGCFQISDSSMSEVVLQCAQLTCLNLNGCPNIGDETLLSLAMRCYAVQPAKSLTEKKDPMDMMTSPVQMQYNSESVGPQELWPEAISTLQPSNRVVKFEIGEVNGSPAVAQPVTDGTVSVAQTKPDIQEDENDDDGIKMSKHYGGVIQEYLDESITDEPLKLSELPMSDRSDVTIFLNVHQVFLMQKLFNDVSTLTVTDLYVAASHNNSSHRTEPSKILEQMKFKRTLELGDIDEVSKRITLTLSSRTSLGFTLVYGEVTVPLPKLIDVPGDRVRMKIPLSEDFYAKLLKSMKKKRPADNDESQEEAYKKAKLSGKKQGQDATAKIVLPTIAVVEFTVELASPVRWLYLLLVCDQIGISLTRFALQLIVQRRENITNPSIVHQATVFISHVVSAAGRQLTAALTKQTQADDGAPKSPPNFLMAKVHDLLKNDASMDLKHGRTFTMAIDRVEEFVVNDIMDNIDAFGTFQRLEKLQLNQCNGATDAGLMDILRHTVGLQVLDIASCERITNSSAILIGKLFPDLQELNISGCWMITDSGFMHIIDNCLHLKRLNIVGCSRISDGQLAGLRDRCTGLTSLSTGGQLVLGPEGILGMISLPCLALLSMPGASFAEVQVSRYLGAASSLVDLNFSEISNIRDWDVCAVLKACVSLQNLDLSMCPAISGNAWNTVAKNCCNLKVLDVSGSDTFNDEHMLSLLANCVLLQEFRASFCKNITEESVSAIIDQGQVLTWLELMGSSISPEGFEELKVALRDTHVIC